MKDAIISATLRVSDIQQTSRVLDLARHTRNHIREGFIYYKVIAGGIKYPNVGWFQIIVCHYTAVVHGRALLQKNWYISPPEQIEQIMRSANRPLLPRD